LIQNLSPAFSRNTPKEFFSDKMELFLTCRKLAEFLRDNVLEKYFGDVLEEIALKSVYRSLFSNISIADLKLLIAELPNILKLNYPVVDELLESVLKIIPELKKVFQFSIDSGEKLTLWGDICELDYVFELVKTFKTCRKK